jgi:tetrahydromethanopterin S-methyltransferase subunit F
MFWLNRQARIESGIKNATVIFYLISFILGFLFAPVFFLIFVFYSEKYKAGIVQAIKETYP